MIRGMIYVAERNIFLPKYPQEILNYGLNKRCWMLPYQNYCTFFQVIRDSLSLAPVDG